MAIQTGGNISKNGLVFHYDMNNRTSWRGKPTTNLCYQQTSIKGKRSDFNFHQYTTDATFNANHPGRIYAINPNGSNLGTMVNTGVNSGNWQVTHHGYWIYDDEMGKPVVVMNDNDGQWKAHSFGTGYSLNSLGWTQGTTTYSISWDGWTSRIDKQANCGIYYRLSDMTSRGFYAGQANSQSTAKNTEPYKWERLYATFTVPTGLDSTYGLGMYNYGHYTGRGTIRMTNLQWEVGTPSHFVVGNDGNPTQTRSNTEALIDIAGGHTVTVTSLTYNNDQTFEYTAGSDDKVTVTHSNDLHPTSAFTSEAWIWADSSQDNPYPRIFDKASMLVHIGQSFPSSIAQNASTSAGLRQVTAGGLQHSTWTHIATSYDGRYGKIYINGELASTNDFGSVLNINSGTGNMTIGDSGDGSRNFNGKISMFKLYNSALSDTEIKKNFNATRGRYGV